MDLIPKDHYFCENDELNTFKTMLLSNDGQILQQIYSSIVYSSDRNEEVWFDIYRSVSGGGDQGGGETE